jgi:hypothetical protein
VRQIVEGVVRELQGDVALGATGAQVLELDLFSMDWCAPMCVTWSRKIAPSSDILLLSKHVRGYSAWWNLIA